MPAAAWRWTSTAARRWGTCAPSGEVSCTGVHGANRLASTSLLEGLLWGWRAGKAAAREAERAPGPFPRCRPWQPEHEPVDPALIAQDWMVIRHTMWNYVGLLRSEKRLDRAGRILSELQVEIEDFYRRGTMSDALLGLRNGVQTALAIHRAASDNRVSRGSHYREDRRLSSGPARRRDGPRGRLAQESVRLIRTEGPR